MPYLKEFSEWLNSHKDYCFDFVRMYLGIGLFIRGVHAMVNPEYLAMFIDKDSFNVMPQLIVHYIQLAHLCGGLLLAIGLLTRLSALIQMPILLGAVFVVHIQEGLFNMSQSLEFSGLVLFLLILCFVHGGGELSVDHILRTDEEQGYLDG